MIKYHTLTIIDTSCKKKKISNYQRTGNFFYNFLDYIDKLKVNIFHGMYLIRNER